MSDTDTCQECGAGLYDRYERFIDNDNQVIATVRHYTCGYVEVEGTGEAVELCCGYLYEHLEKEEQP